MIKEKFESPRYVHNTRIYQVHDVSVAYNDGKVIKAATTYSCDGEVHTTCTEFEIKKIQNTPIYQLWFQDSHLAEIGGLVDEVMAELKEEAAFRRDELKEMN